jgi:histidine ammonia-lyase
MARNNREILNAPHAFNSSAPSEAGQVVVGQGRLTIEDVLTIAGGGITVTLSSTPSFRARIEAGAGFLAELLAAGEEIYGVNTGFGDSCSVRVPPDLVPELPRQLTRYHGCGLGAWLGREETRAVLAARLASLAQGYSGVRWLLLEQLAALINEDILPLIPAEGSVGASGDLTPLSYVAAALMGERTVLHRGEQRAAAAALADAGRQPMALAPKEGLAVMNGTAVMTGLACIAYGRAEYLTRLACRLTALAAHALESDRDHFDPQLFALKPHAGQLQCAEWIHSDLCGEAGTAARLQQRYSIRCAPHVIGVARDALDWIRRDVENELNSANDNPLIDPVRRKVMHGGHFYGGHIAFAMDGLKTAVANLADLLDRQLALLVDARYNEGLPGNLSGAVGRRAVINHGFKAVQIGASAWTAEALKLTMPASAFSRSTECHNQDKVSMGTIAARDCLRVIALTEQVAAAHLLAVLQAVALRAAIGGRPLPAPLAEFRADAGALARFVDDDRPLDGELRDVIGAISRQAWDLY